MVGERVGFLFMSCEESQTNEGAQRTSEFLFNLFIIGVLSYQYKCL